MDVTSIGTFQALKPFDNPIFREAEPDLDQTGTFDFILNSAIDMINETNSYINSAEEAEMSYALGITNSTVDLRTAQMKANYSLQFTVAMRNAVMDAYKEIMQLNF